MSRRSSGGDGLILALVVLGALAMIRVTVPIVRTTWWLAGRLWQRRQPDLAALEIPFRIRDVLGFAAVAAATLIWYPAEELPRAAGAAVNESLLSRTESLLLLVAAVVLVATAFAFLARPGHRRAAWALGAIPVSSVTLTVLLVLLIVWASSGDGGQAVVREAASALDAWARVAPDDPWPVVVRVLAITTVLAASLVLVVAVPVLLAAALWMPTGSFFRAADAHPLMAPVLALILAGWALVRSCIEGAQTPDPYLPVPVAWALAIGGPVIVAGLTVWQMVRLRAAGARFRAQAFSVRASRISAVVFLVLEQGQIRGVALARRLVSRRPVTG